MSRLVACCFASKPVCFHHPALLGLLILGGPNQQTFRGPPLRYGPIRWIAIRRRADRVDRGPLGCHRDQRLARDTRRHRPDRSPRRVLDDRRQEACLRRDTRPDTREDRVHVADRRGRWRVDRLVSLAGRAVRRSRGRLSGLGNAEDEVVASGRAVSRMRVRRSRRRDMEPVSTHLSTCCDRNEAREGLNGVRGRGASGRIRPSGGLDR